MRWLYSLLWVLLAPLLVLRLLIKGRRLPAYRQRILERLGLVNATPSPVDCWVHAVSLGEVIAAIPLIEALLKQNKTVLVTTMTPTGAQKTHAHFSNRVMHRYLPYEIPFALKRFFKQFQPKQGILFETELWPNVIHYAKKARVSLYVLNARLSQKSFKGYQRIRPIVQSMLVEFEAIHAQSPMDAARFIALGAPKSKVHMSGNIKFDLDIPTSINTDVAQIIHRAGDARPIVIAASTHAPEEALLLEQLPALKQRVPNVLFLIAPRHPERFMDVFHVSQRMGFHTGLRSQANTVTPECDVVIVDSLGELLSVYALSDVAFIGGSLVPIGGHNVLEAIAMKVPTITGLFYHHFQAIVDALSAQNAIVLADNPKDVMENARRLLIHPHQSQALVDAGSDVLHSNRGALTRFLKALA